ncbi:MAG: PilZ domain-containing protein [Acidobacteria bacterium]|jgi:hypothetical protein|nr:PilZ domain-containing protein [Acidobacteriota bacterium]
MRDREKRMKASQRIIIQDEGSHFPASIITISKTGMSVKTDHMFPTYKVVDIMVKVAKKFISMKASIRWVNECKDDKGSKCFEVGLSLQNPPPEYTVHFD